MRPWQWDEIVQHPERRLTRGQIDLLRDQNIATLSPERRSALCVRLIIEVDRLHAALSTSQRSYSSAKLGPLD